MDLGPASGQLPPDLLIDDLDKFRPDDSKTWQIHIQLDNHT